jgi:hypothetical protein
LVNAPVSRSNWFVHHMAPLKSVARYNWPKAV